MGFHLHVAPQLEVLADAMAAELSQPLVDPFATELLAVPGDGVRSWLMDQLSRRIGRSTSALDDGIAANIEVVFPASVVRRALAGDPDHQQVISAWSVGSLTWAVHDLLHSGGEEIGVVGDLKRARSIADQFDRYAMHRSEMVRAWEAGRDTDALGRPLPESMGWQPRLWRALGARLGPLSGPAATAAATNRLRLGRIIPDLPPRIFMFGLASIPAPHLRVLFALSAQIDVQVFVPTWSLEVWHRIRQLVSTERLAWPIERSQDPSVHLSHHHLGAQWGRMAREAQLLLVAALATEPDATVTEVAAAGTESRTSELGEQPPLSLLAQIQHDVRTDTAPPGVVEQSPLGRSRRVHDPEDMSISWHRCHGPTRQAEVLRDLVRGLLEERDAQGQLRFALRDIAVLCADPAVSAPMITAAFAADASCPGSEIPIRIADRSLREDSSLFATVGALLDLMEGRFRASDLLAFAALEPVGLRYGWSPDDLGLITDWVKDTGIRWGLDEAQQVAFGLPAGLTVHTWRDGLNQLLLGAVMGDPKLMQPLPESPLADLAHPGIEGEMVRLLGGLAEMVHHLERCDAGFAAVSSPSEWAEVLRTAVRDICRLPDDQAWQWQRLDSQITTLLEESVIGEEAPSAPVAAVEMAELFRAKLLGAPGRVRFGTGAVTVSSLTAQRGVPHRVIVIHGLDEDLSAGTGRADDLIAAQPCLGDRDPRNELRAQLLDAVMAASERLIIIDTGRDITSNEEVPPTVPLAEIADLIDATAVARDPSKGPVSTQITLQHPRHGWGASNFQLSALIPDSPWGFQPADLDAAIARSSRHGRALQVDRWPVLPARHEVINPSVLSIHALVRTLQNPLRTYLSERLGVVITEVAEDLKDLIPLKVPGLEDWQLRALLLEERLRIGDEWSDADLEQWSQRLHRRGRIPPLLFGDAAVTSAASAVKALFESAFPVESAFSEDEKERYLPLQERSVSVDLGQSQVHGVVGNISGSRVIEIQPGSLKAHHILGGWLRLMCLTVAEPESQWSLTMVGWDKSKKKTMSTSLSPRDPVDAERALRSVVDLHRIALQAPVVAPSATAQVIASEGAAAGRIVWDGHAHNPGDRSDRWIRYACGQLDYSDLLDRQPTKFEQGAQWSLAPSQIERWAHRIWSPVLEATSGTTTHSEGIIPIAGDSDG
jgi:exodeoxyribonuclease V gamma subunit